MRKLMKITAVVLLLALTACMLGSCGLLSKGKDIISEYTYELFEAIAEEDYETAVSLFRSDANVNTDELRAFISDAEMRYGIDFSDGIEIIKFTSIEVSAYTTEYGGSKYEGEMSVLVGEERVSVHMLVVDNDDGEGIYSLACS